MSDTEGNATNLPEYSVDQAVTSLLDAEALPEEEQGQEQVGKEEAEGLEAEAPAELEGEAEEDHSEEEPEGEEYTEEDEPEEEPSEPTEELFAIEIDGKKIEVTRDELFRGYRRQSDYTRKFQELAEKRRKTEEQSQAFVQATQQYAETCQMLQEGLAQQGLEDPPAEMEETDPVGYLKAKEQVRSRREKMHQLELEKQNALKQQAAEHQRKFEEHLKGEHEKLIEKLPEWSDPKVAKREKDEMLAYGVTQGFSEQEVRNFSDHRAILVLRKAMAFDALQSNGGVEAKRVRKPVKTIKSGPSKNANSSGNTLRKGREKKAMDRLRQTGDIEDAVDALLARR